MKEEDRPLTKVVESYGVIRETLAAIKRAKNELIAHEMTLTKVSTAITKSAPPTRSEYLLEFLRGLGWRNESKMPYQWWEKHGKYIFKHAECLDGNVLLALLAPIAGVDVEAKDKDRIQALYNKATLGNWLTNKAMAACNMGIETTTDIDLAWGVLRYYGASQPHVCAFAVNLLQAHIAAMHDHPEARKFKADEVAPEWLAAFRGLGLVKD